MIGKNSRYAKVPTRQAIDGQGDRVEALELRAGAGAGAVFQHTPTEGERLDHLAARYYRDPTAFWRICDASDELDPYDVVIPGRPVPIPPNK
jgi:hypothetical protein